MLSKKEAFWQLPGKKTSDILKKLYEVRLQSEEQDIEIPMITLHLISGRDVTGYLIQRTMDTNSISLVLHTKSSHMNAFYVEERQVEAVTIHDIENFTHHFSFGKFWFAPGFPPPTRLDIKKKIAEYHKQLQTILDKDLSVKVLGKGMPEEGDPLRLLDRAICDTISTVKKIAKDDFGKSLIYKDIEKIIFRSGKKNQILLKEKNLNVVVNFENWEAGFIDIYKLRNQIEDSLKYKEKSFLKDLQDEIIPKYQKELQEICGYSIKYEIDWASFQDEFDSMRYFENQGLRYVNQSFRQLTRESIVKENLEKDLQKILMKNNPKGDKTITLQNKTICIESYWGPNSSGYFREEEIRQKLEQFLSADFD